MTAGLVLVALLLTARYTFHRRSGVGYLLVVVSGVWLLVNKTMEGVTILTFSQDHGLTAGDLAGLAGVALGLRQAWPDLVRRVKWLYATVRH